MVTDTDMAMMRAESERLMPSTCQIQRVSGGGSDDQGGWSPSTFATVATVKCRLSPMAGNEQRFTQQTQEVANWVLTLPAGTDIRDDDNILVDGKAFQVAQVSSGRSREIAIRAALTEGSL